MPLLILNFVAQEIHGTEFKMGWSHWSSWTTCSTTCGEGEMLRSRTCIGACLANEHGAHEAKACNLASCEGIKNISNYNVVKLLIYLEATNIINLLFICSSNADFS